MTDELLTELRQIRRLLEAIAEDNYVCVHEWEAHRTRWMAYDQCVNCGKKRRPVD